MKILLLLVSLTISVQHIATRRSLNKWACQAPTRTADIGRGDCALPYDSVPGDFHKPFLVNHDPPTILYPEEVTGGGRSLVLPAESRVMVSCPASSLVNFKKEYVYLKCSKGVLWYGNKKISWSELGCVERVKEGLEEGEPCGVGGEGTTYRITWPLRRGTSLPQVTLCFHSPTDSTLYAHHVIHGRYIKSKTVAPGRPYFKTHRLFDSGVQDAYNKVKQKALAERLLGSSELLSGRGQQFLARGHLAPDSDFVLAAEQDATYYLLNAAPQWQAINNGNWKAMEDSARSLAGCLGRDLDVWTGTHGTLRLPTSTGASVPIHLDQQGTQLPVPALMWKAVHDPWTHQGLILVMVNDVTGQGTVGSTSRRGSRRLKRRSRGSRNSRRRASKNRGSRGISRLSERSVLSPPCNDLCGVVKWVDWPVDDVSKGRTFCCALDDPSLPFLNLPSFTGVDLLRG